jgi:hypothetical protein
VCNGSFRAWILDRERYIFRASVGVLPVHSHEYLHGAPKHTRAVLYLHLVFKACRVLTSRADKTASRCEGYPYIHRSFQKFCTLRLRGQEDDAIILIFATVVSHTSVKNIACVLADYAVHVLQNRALKWKKKLTGVRSRAVTSDHTLNLKLCEEKNPTEIRNAVHEVCGDSVVDRSTVSTWIRDFEPQLKSQPSQ